jgi:hypothetical protein
MDEVLLSNFMVFHGVVTDVHYDLVVGDEAWDVDRRAMHDRVEGNDDALVRHLGKCVAPER